MRQNIVSALSDPRRLNSLQRKVLEGSRAANLAQQAAGQAGLMLAEASRAQAAADAETFSETDFPGHSEDEVKQFCAMVGRPISYLKANAIQPSQCRLEIYRTYPAYSAKGEQITGHLSGLDFSWPWTIADVKESVVGSCGGGRYEFKVVSPSGRSVGMLTFSERGAPKESAVEVPVQVPEAQQPVTAEQVQMLLQQQEERFQAQRLADQEAVFRRERSEKRKRFMQKLMDSNERLAAEVASIRNSPPKEDGGSRIMEGITTTMRMIMEAQANNSKEAQGILLRALETKDATEERTYNTFRLGLRMARDMFAGKEEGEGEGGGVGSLIKDVAAGVKMIFDQQGGVPQGPNVSKEEALAAIERGAREGAAQAVARRAGQAPSAALPKPPAQAPAGSVPLPPAPKPQPVDARKAAVEKAIYHLGLDLDMRPERASFIPVVLQFPLDLRETIRNAKSAPEIVTALAPFTTGAALDSLGAKLNSQPAQDWLAPRLTELKTALDAMAGVKPNA